MWQPYFLAPGMTNHTVYTKGGFLMFLMNCYFLGELQALQLVPFKTDMQNRHKKNTEKKYMKWGGKNRNR